MYQVKEKLGAQTTTSNIRVLIDLGLNAKDHMIVNVKRLEGEHLYYKKIANELRKGFAYCLVKNKKSKWETLVDTKVQIIIQPSVILLFMRLWNFYRKNYSVNSIINIIESEDMNNKR